VIHVITDSLEDHTSLLHSVGEMHFPHRTSPGDGAAHGGTPDLRHWENRPKDIYPPPFRTGGEPHVIEVKSRNFH
jgi:error-prone DNA polymerase